MKNKAKYIFIVIALCSLLIFTGVKLIPSDIDKSNSEFLKSFGWDVSIPCIEKVDFTIPDTFDDVYNSYNELQIQSGFDLGKYCGRSATRYTYNVKNFPDCKSGVRANVVCIGATPIGGDIMTVELGGFMYPLNYKP